MCTKIDSSRSLIRKGWHFQPQGGATKGKSFAKYLILIEIIWKQMINYTSYKFPKTHPFGIEKGNKLFLS